MVAERHRLRGDISDRMTEAEYIDGKSHGGGGGGGTVMMSTTSQQQQVSACVDGWILMRVEVCVRVVMMV